MSSPCSNHFYFCLQHGLLMYPPVDNAGSMSVSLETSNTTSPATLVKAPVLRGGLAQYLLGDRSELQDPQPEQYEVALLIITGTIGMIANFAIIVIILVLTNLRRASNAFLVHHCLLDFLKAGFCLPFAQTMVSDYDPMFCSLLGGSYIVVVTSSTFNLLAVVMNEAYLFSDLTLGVKDSRNYCCVIFGIFMIWFASIIMNLGVAFIPGNPIYDRRVGHCIFIYGITRNYVLHMLWISLISLGLGLTCMYLHKFRIDIKRTSYYRLSTLVRATVTIDSKATTSTQRHVSEIREKLHVEFVQRVTMRKLCLLVFLVALFITFWYPLFILSIVDPHFNAPSRLYKALTMLAWSNPSLSPFIIMYFIKKACCCGCCHTDGSDLDTEVLAETAAAMEEARSVASVDAIPATILDDENTRQQRALLTRSEEFLSHADTLPTRTNVSFPPTTASLTHTNPSLIRSSADSLLTCTDTLLTHPDASHTSLTRTRPSLPRTNPPLVRAGTDPSSTDSLLTRPNAVPRTNPTLTRTDVSLPRNDPRRTDPSKWM